MAKFKMKINLQEANFERSSSAETINFNDFSELGDVMYEAFKGTIDYDDESREDATVEVKNTLEGKYGKIVADACLKIKEQEEIASAIVYNILEEDNLPMMTFAMTREKFKRKGFSQQLIKESLMKLKDLGYKECLLFVTEGNKPAVSIYKKVGFQNI